MNWELKDPILITFLIESQMSSTFWVNAIQTVVFTIDRLPTPTLQRQSPFEKLFHHFSDYYFVKAFRFIIQNFLPPLQTNLQLDLLVVFC